VKRDFGRHVYGVAAIVIGATAFLWHDVDKWPEIRAFASPAYLVAIFYVAAAALVVGGLAIQWRASAKLGAVALGAVYLLFAILWIPGIIRAPLIYNSWGSVFEQFSIFSGAVIAYSSLASSGSPSAARAGGIGRIFFGISVVSLTLEQAFYLQNTADLVPKWIPPGQLFWAVTTTVAFGLAAIAILSGRQALLASRLLTAMLLLFGILVWVPMLFADPHSHANWSESAVTLAIAGVAWILADYLVSANGQGRRRPRS
jgi:hypothetical protein